MRDLTLPLGVAVGPNLVAVAANGLNLLLRICFSAHFLSNQVEGPAVLPATGPAAGPRTVGEALTGALPGLPVVASLLAVSAATLLSQPQETDEGLAWVRPTLSW